MLDVTAGWPMEHAVAIDQDVLLACEGDGRAAASQSGRVISDLARKSLHKPQPPARRNGIPLLGVQPGAVVTWRSTAARRTAVTFLLRRQCSDRADRSGPCRARCGTMAGSARWATELGNLSDGRERRHAHRRPSEIPNIVRIACGGRRYRRQVAELSAIISGPTT